MKLKYTWRVILVLFLIGVVYLFKVAFEVKEVITEFSPKEKIEINEETILLEKNSLLKRNQFLNLKKFTDNSLYSQENIKELNSDEFLVLDDIYLKRTLLNSCREVNCLQFRLRFDEIPSVFWQGLMGIEDSRFLDHNGIDPISILRAIFVDIKTLSLAQGGSTLTQQLVKNTFLDSEKTFKRKIMEVFFSIYLEKGFSKEEILTIYLNEMYWGVVSGVKIKGIQAASFAYFNKNIESLSEYEVSILIGLLKGPGYYSPLKNTEKAKERANVVYEKLKSEHFISGVGTEKWDDKKWKEFEKNLKERNTKSFLKTLSHLLRRESSFLNLYKEFVVIENIQELLLKAKNENKGQDLAFKIYILNKNCENDPCEKSFFYYTKEERSFYTALNSEKHQVGSILKPFSYEFFREKGMSWNDEVQVKDITLKLKSGDWTPKNSHKINHDFVTAKEALQDSLNTPLIYLANKYGFFDLEIFLKNYFSDLKSPLSEYPAQLLGAYETTIQKLTNSYLKFIKKICADIGNGNYNEEDSVLFQLTDHKNTTIKNLLKKNMEHFKFFGKTGTTNNSSDNWYVAFDGENFYTLWFGRETLKGDGKLKASGASTAFRVFQDFILYKGERIRDFECR